MAIFNLSDKLTMPTLDQALPGRTHTMPLSAPHHVLGSSLQAPFAEGSKKLLLGMGCFWGVERKLWQQKGILVTAVGYAGGLTPNATYEEVCSGMTGHNEVVLVVYDPGQTSLEELLAVFWQCHNPTQGMRQGNDVGTQYRSGIYLYNEADLQLAEASHVTYATCLQQAGVAAAITTEIMPAPEFYYAEAYHQQYLAKNPGGYCGLAGIGVNYS
jgi:peptide-methionine (S)-S-oxide reductase